MREIVYYVINTIRIGDTDLLQEVLLSNLKKNISFYLKWIKSNYFVNNVHFTNEEIKVYNLLLIIIFDNHT